MNIKILKPTIANGESVSVGDELEVSDREGRILCSIGKAENLDATVELEVTVDVKNLEAVKEQIASLEKELEEKDALIAQMEQDINNMTLKALKEKYPVLSVATEIELKEAEED